MRTHLLGTLPQNQRFRSASRTITGTKLERFRESADVTSFVSDGNPEKAIITS